MKPQGSVALVFSVGAPVRSTPLALKNGVVKKPMTGRVVGFSHGGYSLLVLPDGYKCAQSYHPDFWEPAPPRRKPRP